MYLEWSYKTKWTTVQNKLRFDGLKSIYIDKIETKLNGITISIHLQITRIWYDTQRFYRLYRGELCFLLYALRANEHRSVICKSCVFYF